MLRTCPPMPPRCPMLCARERSDPDANVPQPLELGQNRPGCIPLSPCPGRAGKRPFVSRSTRSFGDFRAGRTRLLEASIDAPDGGVSEALSDFHHAEAATGVHSASSGGAHGKPSRSSPQRHRPVEGQSEPTALRSRLGAILAGTSESDGTKSGGLHGPQCLHRRRHASIE
jgi:hypothetical protein